MSFSIPPTVMKILVITLGVISTVGIIFNSDQIFILVVLFIYIFLIPAHLIERYLQNTFVGLQLRGRAMFFIPIMLPFMIVISTPFWGYSLQNIGISFDWETLILISAIIINSFLLIRNFKSLTIQLISQPLGYLFIWLFGSIFGFLFAWLI
jgi:hypothetical protein